MVKFSTYLNRCVFVMKRKQFAPVVRKFFPFGEDVFSEELGVQESNQEVTKVVILVKQQLRNTKGIHCP